MASIELTVRCEVLMASGGGLEYFLFSPRKLLGEDEPIFDDHIFSDGLGKNHQPDGFDDFFHAEIVSYFFREGWDGRTVETVDGRKSKTTT